MFRNRNRGSLFSDLLLEEWATQHLLFTTNITNNKETQIEDADIFRVLNVVAVTVATDDDDDSSIPVVVPEMILCGPFSSLSSSSSQSQSQHYPYLLNE